VAYLTRLITDLGGRPLIVSRGYGRPSGASADDRNDEARELELLCPGVPHVQNPDRAAAIHEWLAAPSSRNDLRGGSPTCRDCEAGSRENAASSSGGSETHRAAPETSEPLPCDLIILDDGFQHRRLARNLDIVLIDATCPLGYGHVLPRGLLREPPSALRRAGLIVITRADMVAAVDLVRLKQDLARLTATGTPILVARHQPTRVIMMDGSEKEDASLRGLPVAGACGIGNPGAFRRTLEELGADIRLFRIFDDHHAYTPGEIRELLVATATSGAKMLVTTGKDAVKWRPLIEAESTPAAVTVASVEVALVITEGEEALRRRLADLLAAGKTPGDRRR
jgi:tetraacyldisaccharide 4'-kinase